MNYFVTKKQTEPHWTPYCLKCSTSRRMQDRAYGYQCLNCQNTIDFQLYYYPLALYQSLNVSLKLIFEDLTHHNLVPQTLNQDKVIAIGNRIGKNHLVIGNAIARLSFETFLNFIQPLFKEPRSPKLEPGARTYKTYRATQAWVEDKLHVRVYDRELEIAQFVGVESCSGAGNFYPLTLKVLPDYQRQGIATFIYEWVEETVQMPIEPKDRPSLNGRRFRKAWQLRRLTLSQSIS
jgi:GNAT superfamily N-acetyltransferase